METGPMMMENKFGLLV